MARGAAGLALFGMLMLSGIALGECATPASSPVIPAYAAVSVYSAPVDLDYDDTDLGSKIGTSAVHTILGIVSFGDCSAATAAANGGIKVIKHSDCKVINALFFYSSYTTIVYGD